MKVKVKEHELYLDGYLHKNLESLKEIIKKDWDFLCIVDGIEGGGKSVFAQQIAYFVSEGKLTLDHICFTPDDFKEAIINAEKYSAIIFDEAFRGLSSRAAMSQTNKILVSMLQEIRQKNLFVFILLPSIWDVDKYVALHRTSGVLHVYTGEKRQRGFFSFYSPDKIKYLFRNRQKYLYSHPKNNADFIGRFTSYSPIDQEAYKAKKLQSLQDYSVKRDDEATELANSRLESWQRAVCVLLELLKKTGFTYEVLYDKIGFSRRYMQEIRKRFSSSSVSLEGEEYQNER